MLSIRTSIAHISITRANAQKLYFTDHVCGVVINLASKEKEMADKKIGRDAKTGKFIPVKEAKKRPNTTTVETIKKG